MTLTCVSAGWTGQRHRLLDSAGHEVGRLEVSNWRDAAVLTLGDVGYAVRKDPLDGALVVAGPDGLPVAQAVRPSLWKAEYDLDWGDGRGRLYRPSAWKTGRFVVDDADGERQATLTQRGLWRPRLEVGTVDAWPLARTAFVAALALFVLRAERAAAAS